MNTGQSYDPAGSGASNPVSPPQSGTPESTSLPPYSPLRSAPIQLDLDQYFRQDADSSTTIVVYRALAHYKKDRIEKMLIAHAKGDYERSYFLFGELERLELLTTDLAEQIDSIVQGYYQGEEYDRDPEGYTLWEKEQEELLALALEKYQAVYFPPA